MNIGYVLSRAWQIIWRHKILWIFGILAGCSSSAASSGSNSNSITFSGSISPEIQSFFERFSPAQWGVLIGVSIFLLLALIILAIFLGTIGRTGLILGTLQAERGAERLGFGELFRGSLPYFWRVLGLSLLIGLIIMVLIFGLVIFSIIGAAVTLGLIFICLIPIFCLLIPLLWFVYILVEQGTIAIITEDMGVIDGLKRGWQVFSANLGSMILMGLILILGISGIGGFILALPILLIFAPVMISVLNGSPDAWQSGLLISGLCFVLYLPVLILLSGILQSYVSSAWTLTYLNLTTAPSRPEKDLIPDPA